MRGINCTALWIKVLYKCSPFTILVGTGLFTSLKHPGVFPQMFTFQFLLFNNVSVGKRKFEISKHSFFKENKIY